MGGVGTQEKGNWAPFLFQGHLDGLRTGIMETVLGFPDNTNLCSQPWWLLGRPRELRYKGERESLGAPGSLARPF